MKELNKTLNVLVNLLEWKCGNHRKPYDGIASIKSTDNTQALKSLVPFVKEHYPAYTIINQTESNEAQGEFYFRIKKKESESTPNDSTSLRTHVKQSSSKEPQPTNVEIINEILTAKAKRRAARPLLVGEIIKQIRQHEQSGKPKPSKEAIEYFTYIKNQAK